MNTKKNLNQNNSVKNYDQTRPTKEILFDDKYLYK